ncbi:sensor histidine kinase [Actinacidiphila sp. bgisy160]|uniref:sensor histidine kinase n=1 Tax=Actinacidiphila sp. bgisy160 TaxID=3413796 RepID=UPI003D71A51C
MCSGCGRRSGRSASRRCAASATSSGADAVTARPGGPATRRGRPLAKIGLRWKVCVAIAVVSALVALVLSLVVHNAARASMIDNSRDVQNERVQFAQRIYESTGRLTIDARLDDPDLPAPLKRLAREGKRATYVSGTGGAPVVWAETPLADGKILSLRTAFTDRFSVLEDLDQALVIGSSAVVVGGTALGVLIGGQLSRRLRKAAEAAGRVADGETDVRVRDAIGGRVRDETDELARAVDAMADALAGRLEAERRVTADIAHELRTPVTGLVTAAELLPPGRPAELVRDRSQALRTLVEDVLEVARLDGAAEQADLQGVALGDFVRRRVAAAAPEATVTVRGDAVVRTDPRRLERVLGNLLANAARHGRPPVEVTVDGPYVEVRDHGPGFPGDLLRDGPSRFRTGSSDRAGSGHGLGLTIATGQTRVLGARLTFRNVPQEEGGGAVARLLLPRD